MTRDKYKLEVFCSWCARNLENLNEYVARDSFRWQQASHGVCSRCKKQELDRGDIEYEQRKDK